MAECLLCSEAIAASDEVSDAIVNGLTHRECIVRSAVGGIGHHEDHAYWCKEMHDPDGGRSYRESALEVQELIERIGVDAVVKGSIVSD